MTINPDHQAMAKAAVLKAQQEAAAVFERWLAAAENPVGGTAMLALANEQLFGEAVREAEELLNILIGEAA